MHIPKTLSGFDPRWFEDQEGTLHRRPKGRRIEVRLSAYVLLVRPGDSIRRPPNVLTVSPKWRPDRRELPGGGVSVGEPLRRGAAREVKEELGIDVELPESGALCFDRSFLLRNGSTMRYCQAVATVFVARFPEACADALRADPEEVARFEWIEARTARPPSRLHPMFLPHWAVLAREARRLVV